MNTKVVLISACLYFGILLFARHPQPTTPSHLFRGVNDLSIAASAAHPSESQSVIYAPSGKSVNEITPDRLVAPIVVLENPHSQVGLDEVESYERAHGSIRPGALVVLPKDADLNADALEFLTAGRNIYGLAMTPEHHEATVMAAERQGLYVVSQLQGVDKLPASGAIAVVAPLAGANKASTLARVYALLR
jgi:kynurenine formamidase